MSRTLLPCEASARLSPERISACKGRRSEIARRMLREPFRLLSARGASHESKRPSPRIPCAEDLKRSRTRTSLWSVPAQRRNIDPTMNEANPQLLECGGCFPFYLQKTHFVIVINFVPLLRTALNSEQQIPPRR